ncbi:MAG: GIY-YIG nuclease family protein [Mariniphaga sp.]|nr:GIY-YIG nuclease family protein [Mariniphaga sp.]
MKYFTYILESQNSGKLYIGQTSNLMKRVERHNSGGSPYTRGKGPWKLIFLMEFSTRTEAIHMERKLKGFKNTQRIYEWINRNKSSGG